MMQNVAIEGKEIQRVVFDRLIPAIEGEQYEVQLLSLLTLSVFLVKPNIGFDELQAVVLDLSEQLALRTMDSKSVN